VSSFHAVLHIHSRVILDWFIFRGRRDFYLDVNPRHSSEPTGHIQLLPRKYSPGAHWLESIQYFPPFFPTNVHSTNVWYLDQFPLVLELGHQHDMRRPRKFATAVGTEIPEGHTATFHCQRTQAGSLPRFLC
jgi:hypothetical protein